jgi:hypothetical protein
MRIRSSSVGPLVIDGVMRASASSVQREVVPRANDEAELRLLPDADAASVKPAMR